MTKLDRIRALAWHRLPANATLEHVFELVIDDALKRNDPWPGANNVRAASWQELRRDNRSPSGAPPKSSSPAGDAPDPRRIPVRMRDDVFARDHGRCTFVGPDGRRCDATRGLQIDHIVPVAQGGTGEIGNLRLLCAQHNRLLAERLLSARVDRLSGGTGHEEPS